MGLKEQLGSHIHHLPLGWFLAGLFRFQENGSERQCLGAGFQQENGQIGSDG
jgi:hypothetical protein